MIMYVGSIDSDKAVSVKFSKGQRQNNNLTTFLLSGEIIDVSDEFESDFDGKESCVTVTHISNVSMISLQNNDEVISLLKQKLVDNISAKYWQE